MDEEKRMEHTLSPLVDHFKSAKMNEVPKVFTCSLVSHSLLLSWQARREESICSLMRSLVSFHTGRGT